MNLTLVIFLYLYFFFLAGWVIFSLIAVYHVLTSGIKNVFIFLTVIIYAVCAVVILSVTVAKLSGTDWKVSLISFDQPTQSQYFSN